MTTPSHIWGGEQEKKGWVYNPYHSFFLTPAQLDVRISPRTAKGREGITAAGWWHRPACHRDLNLRGGAGRRRTTPEAGVMRRPWRARVPKSWPPSQLLRRKPRPSPPHPLLSARTARFYPQAPGSLSPWPGGPPRLPAAPRETGRSLAARPPPSQTTPGLRSPSREPAPRPPAGAVATAASAAAGTTPAETGGSEEVGPAGSRGPSSRGAR